MADTSILKSEIDNKLQKERNNLQVLKEAMNKSNNNTDNMLTLLESFQNRLQKLEATVEPVYNETEMLRRRQENIEKTINTLDSVLGYYHVAREVEAEIREGPESVGLDPYLSKMDKLLRAHDYFQKHNPTSLDLADVARVYDDGKDCLQMAFKTLLSRHERPVPPIMILDLVGTEDDLHSSEPDIPLEHLPEKIVQDLGKIAKWLIQFGNSTEFLKDYTFMRASIMVKSLSGLKEHMKSTNAGIVGNILTPGQASPNPNIKFRPQEKTPVRKSMKKIAHSFRKRATSALIQSPFDPAMRRDSLMSLKGHRRQNSSTDLREENLDVEVDIYITELSALLKLMQSEHQLMVGIIPEKHHRTVFDGIVQQGLDAIVNEGETFASNAKKSISRRDFMAILPIFPVVKHLRTIKPEFDFTLEGCPAPTRAKLASLLSILGSTGAKALEEFIESIRSDPDKSNMPKDGTVHELTNHTIVFLEPLIDYAETAGSMLLMHGEQAAPSEAYDAKKSKLRFADYCTKVLNALGLNLSNKGSTYPDPFLTPIFMLNNYNYILKSITRSGLLDLIHTWNKDVRTHYEEQINEQKRRYSQSWSKVMHYVLDMNEPMSVQRTTSPEMSKLKEKQRQNIKDKFTGFNKELEDITKTQKGYAVPDPELREILKEDNKKFVCPSYKIFLEKYDKMNFTKNKEKYIKYSVEDVNKMIDQFFDTSA